MFEELKDEAESARKNNKDFDGKGWWNKQIPKIEKEFGVEPLNYKWKLPIKDKKVNLDDKSDDFDENGAKPSHFYNQLVRIPQRKELTPEAIMQIGINIGFGKAVGSVDRDYSIEDFMESEV